MTASAEIKAPPVIETRGAYFFSNSNTKSLLCHAQDTPQPPEIRPAPQRDGIGDVAELPLGLDPERHRMILQHWFGKRPASVAPLDATNTRYLSPPPFCEIQA